MRILWIIYIYNMDVSMDAKAISRLQPAAYSQILYIFRSMPLLAVSAARTDHVGQLHGDLLQAPYMIDTIPLHT